MLTRRLTVVFAVIVSLLLGSIAPAAESAAYIPTEQFLLKPKLNRLKLSSDGSLLAYVADINDRDHLVVMSLATGEKQPVAHFEETQVLNYWWKSNEQIVLLVHNRYRGRDFRSFNFSTRKVTNLVKFSDGGVIVNPLANDPKHMIVAVYDGAGSDLRRLDVQTGKTTVIARNPGFAEHWLHDPVSQRSAALCREKQNWVLKYRSAAKETAWESRILGPEFRPDLWPVAFAEDGRRLIAYDYTSGGPASVILLDPATGATEPLVSSKESDPVGIHNWTDETHRPRVIRYDTDRAILHALTPKDATFLKSIDASLPGTANFILSQSRDGQKSVIFAENPNDPGIFYLLDRTKGAITPLGLVNPHLAPERLGESRHFKFQGEGGLQLTGRVYLPPGVAKPPLVVMVSPNFDGPRADSNFYRNVQLFTHRGYAVAKIDHRGMSGFGRNFQDAGEKEITGKIPDDIIAGARHVIAQGWADGNRVAIYGEYSGGICAINALARSDLFSAWVNFHTYIYTQWLDYDSVAFGDTKLSDAPRPLGGFRQAKEYRQSLDPRPLLKQVRVPSFHHYAHDDGDAPRLEKHLKDGNQPYQMSRPIWRNYSDLNFEQALQQERKDEAAICDAMLAFLDQHVKNKPASVR